MGLAFMGVVSMSSRSKGNCSTLPMQFWENANPCSKGSRSLRKEFFLA